MFRPAGADRVAEADLDLPRTGVPGKVFTEQNHQLARPRGLLTVRACWWTISQLRGEHTSVHGLARQLGTTRQTVWRSIAPLLQMADDLPGSTTPPPWGG